MTDGAVVIDVAANSSAADAGIEQFDVITAINDEPVTDGQVLRQLLYEYQVGDTITLTIIRGGEEQQIEVTLEASPTTNTQPAQ